MENKSEVYKQIVLSVVRHLLTALATFLIAKGVISSDQANFLITEAAGIFFGGLSLLVMWIKSKNSVKLVQAAIDATPGTSLKAVKEAAKDY